MEPHVPPEPLDDKDPFLDEDDDEAEEIHARDLGFLVRFLGPFTHPNRRLFLGLGLVLLVETVFNFSFPLATQYLLVETAPEEGVQEIARWRASLRHDTRVYW